ncbi:hypothetical protein [Streptomyces violaceusniger]|uniref:Uncharacterized protein n=1 Tax=Streptomyces violaceusniger (strain Tu 4113) TaxID=653045 RepID=G2P7P9_STRV4|nr:hypothetical protein [Streptomyces violaceusniger]AEM87361.1 hypothetical protein Strvi_8038 [Streptomyces violaceusniger Tu 4113]
MSTPPPVEERLRAALDARARLIDAHELSPYRPPTGPAWGTRRIRRVASAVAVAAAAAAAVAFLLLSGSPEDNRPAPPARDPRTSSPATSTPSSNTSPTFKPSPTSPPARPETVSPGR